MKLFYAALPLIPRALLGGVVNGAVYEWAKNQDWDIMQHNAVLPYFVHLLVRKLVYITYPVQVLMQVVVSPTSIGYTFWNFFHIEKEWNPR